VLRELTHPNIVNLIDVIMDSTKIYLVFEFLYMDLKKYIDDQKNQGSRIDIDLTTSYVFQLCQVTQSLQFHFCPNFDFLRKIQFLVKSSIFCEQFVFLRKVRFFA